MAKPKKGGLGRGLNSLLGSEFESTMAQEPPAPAERVTVEPSKSEKMPEPPKAPKQEPAKPPVPAEGKKQVKDDDIYSSKEDNITIKGVVARPAARKEEPAVKHEKEEKRVVNRVERRDADEVPLELVHPNPNQPRTNFKKEELEELAESIKKNGMLQPILVRRDGDSYEIIAGERRWQACKLIGMKSVPVRIREADDEEAIVLALIENIQRSDLNPIEEAYGYRRMMERGKMTQTQVAQAVSKGRSTIANALRLLELPEDAQELLFDEKITAGHARAILSVPTPEGREKLTQKLMKEQISVRETEAIARLMSGKRDVATTERVPAPKSYKTVARSLRDVLQTDVSVKSSKGKNKIEITFKDEADLERLFRIIAAE